MRALPSAGLIACSSCAIFSEAGKSGYIARRWVNRSQKCLYSLESPSKIGISVLGSR